MYVIGERINGMWKDVKQAIVDQDPGPIKSWTEKQIAAGADALDVNVGPATSKQVEALLWMCEIIRGISADFPIAIDNAKWAVMKEVVPQVPGPKIINSTKADPGPLAEYCGLAAEHDCSIVGLTIDQRGIPHDVDTRVEMGATILTVAMEAGLTPDRIFIDTIIQPVNVAPKQPLAVMKAMEQLKMLSDPPPHQVLGLSNVSQGARNRELINRTYIAMAVPCGLDSAIMDPCDKELMEAAITAELIMEKMIYCDSYIEAYLANK
ncbi:MAG: dihydropteroate synthase [Phycisphaerae bacterium]|nr:dihydropteroate synthase [Phycisphaerae bacterium]